MPPSSVRKFFQHLVSEKKEKISHTSRRIPFLRSFRLGSVRQYAFPTLMLNFTHTIRARECSVELLFHTNEESIELGLTPFDHGSSLYTRVMTTEALRQALESHRFNAAIGGTRRDFESMKQDGYF